ncbi:MAG: hypothetical protein KJN90_08905, partial [Gammaproteobacteria bacterium]|nr:hypothetical protein [Gammaproteobacteria bacterium]
IPNTYPELEYEEMTDQNPEPEKQAEAEPATTAEQNIESPRQEQGEPSQSSIDHDSVAGVEGKERRKGEQDDDQKMKDIWPHLRQLLVFQIKLYIDAARDLLMSPLSIVVFIIDAVQGNRGEKSLFESLLQFGRRTEKAINLFNQHDVNDENYRGIDSILLQVEEAVRKEYTDGSVSANARDSIEKSLDKLRSKVNQSKQEDE